ncbi:MAG: hypothetical protein AB4426_17385 [Xenococcaceae cyanobacterium]
MTNSINAETCEFLKSFQSTSPSQEAKARQAAQSASLGVFGEASSLSELINLGKAVKLVAAVDGFAKIEEQGMDKLYDEMGMPDEVKNHLKSFQAHTATLSEVAQLFPTGSKKAKRVLASAIFVASEDGLSDEEKQSAIKLAQHLGLRKELVDAYEAGIEFDKLLTTKCNDMELFEGLGKLRWAMWELD